MPPAEISTENHTLLVQLSDQVGNVGRQLEGFLEAQTKENQRLHERIDLAQARSADAVTSIKDALASKGRVSGSFILSLTAVLFSSAAIIGGAVTTYVTGRMETINPSIQAQASEIARNREYVDEMRVRTAANDAASEADRTWIKRELDRIGEMAHKGISNPNPKTPHP
jgi:hypothetical protein